MFDIEVFKKIMNACCGYILIIQSKSYSHNFYFPSVYWRRWVNIEYLKRDETILIEHLVLRRRWLISEKKSLNFF